MYCEQLNKYQGVKQLLRAETDKQFLPFIAIIKALRENDEDLMYENITDFIYSFTKTLDVICVLKFLSTHLASSPLYPHIAKEFLENHVLDDDIAKVATSGQIEKVVRLAYPFARLRMSEDDRLTWLVMMYETYRFSKSVIPAILYCLQSDRTLVQPFVRNYLTRFDNLDKRILALLTTKDNQDIFRFISRNIVAQLSASSPKKRTAFPFSALTVQDKKRLLTWAYHRKKDMPTSEILRRQVDEALVIYNRLKEAMMARGVLMTRSQLRSRIRKISNIKIRDIVARLLERQYKKAEERHQRDVVRYIL